MKKVLFIFLVLILAGCSSQLKYSDFDYSYTRSGGKLITYENLLIKGTDVHYSFEGPEKKFKKDFKISNQEVKNIENIISTHNFRTIQEDYKKVYDRVSTTITVKNGENSGRKSDAALIMEKDKMRWDEIKIIFQQIIDSNTADSKK